MSGKNESRSTGLPKEWRIGKPWRVIAGNPVDNSPHEDRYDMRIEDENNDGFYELYCDEWPPGRREGPTKTAHLQQLQYRPETNTFEDRGRQNEPERCIVLWLRRGGKKSIFAKRVGAVTTIPKGDLPLFEQGGAGSWGAEGG